MEPLHYSGCFGIIQWNRSLIPYSRNPWDLHSPSSPDLPVQIPEQRNEKCHSLQESYFNVSCQFCAKEKVQDRILILL